MFFLFIFSVASGAEPAKGTLEEVSKGDIPEKYLKKTLKKLPIGIRVWDVEETFKNFNDKNVVWIDTRPSSFFQNGTFRPAVNYVYNKNEKIVISSKERETPLTKAALKDLQKQSGVKEPVFVFFCQGPKCHRSYNAALATVQRWGYPADRIVWLRAGFPNVLKAIDTNPKLKMKKARYIKGKILAH